MTRRATWSMTGAWLVAALWCAGGADPADAALSADALRTIRHLPIQHNGRTKPFDSFARETLKHLTGSPRHGAQDPVETVLGILASPERWQAEPLLAIPFVPLREALGLDRRTTHVSYDQLIETRALMRRLPAIVEKQRRDEKLSMLEQETMDAFDRFVAFSQLVEHKLALVPPPAVAASGSSARSAGPFRPAAGGGMTNRKHEMVLNAALLLEKTSVNRLAEEVRILRQDYAPHGFEFESVGPFPPYNFSRLPACAESSEAGQPEGVVHE